MSKLTAAAVAGLPATVPEGKAQIEIADHVRGLVVVASRTTITFRLRFRLHGRARKLTIGRFPGLSLAEARRTAERFMADVDAGREPGTPRPGEEPAPPSETVGEAWGRYWPQQAMRLRHPRQDEAKWRLYLAPFLADRSVADLSPAVFDDLQAQWRKEGLGSSQASLVRVLKTFEAWMLDRRVIDRPWMPRRITTPAHRTPPVPPLDAARGLLRWCDARGDAVAAQLALLLLTGARRAMIQGLRWAEVHEDRLSWPADRMKGARPFSQPLSAPARAWIDRQARRSEFVFPSLHGRTANSADLHVVVRESGHWRGHTVHSMRACLATHGRDHLGWPPHLIASLLDHSPRSIMPGATAVYGGSGDLYWGERVQALNDWANLIAGAEA